MIRCKLFTPVRNSDWHWGFSFLYISVRKGRNSIDWFSILITNIHGVDMFLICFISRFQGHKTPIKLVGIQFFVGEQPISYIKSKASEEWMFPLRSLCSY